MALINYVEPVSAGETFIGLGGLILFITISYIIYRFYGKLCQFFDIVINRAAKYEILEETFLDKIATTKGVDLNKELIKRKMINNTKRRSFRGKIEEKIYEEMFGKEETKEDKK